MRRLTLTALLMAVVAVAAPSAASAATPAQSVGTAIPAPTVITTRIDGVPMTETYDGGGGLPYLGSATSYNAGDWEKNLKAYADGPVYQSQLEKVDSVADRWVTHRGWRGHHGRGHGAHHARAAHHRHNGRGHTRPALVLDIDETSLSNLSAIEADNFTFGPNSQAEATNEIGTAITPTLQVFKDAQARGVAVFFITGRGEASRAHTESNLRREG
jgi:HAD superfamily, subfamily IIIB (Acid phosphatase)